MQAHSLEQKPLEQKRQVQGQRVQVLRGQVSVRPEPEARPV